MALRLEQSVGDFVWAHSIWREIKHRYDKDSANRAWYLLAARKERDLADRAMVDQRDVEIQAERLRALEARLAAIQQAAADPKNPNPDAVEEARRACQELFALYKDDADPDLKAVAHKAAEVLAKLPRGGLDKP